MYILGLQKTTLLDYPGHVASTIFTGGCNFRCPYCHNADLVVNTTDTESYSQFEVMEHLSKRRNVLDGVCISGGEPTLQPDLPSFIAQIKSLDLSVKLDTNGSNPVLLRELVADGLIDYVAMDIKHTRIKYPSVACCSSFSLDDIAASVDYLKENHVDYEFRTTLVKELHTINDITSLGVWLSGATRYFLQPYRDSENVIQPGFHAHSKEELETFVSILQKIIPETSIRGLD